jgi:hypothetical protein
MARAKLNSRRADSAATPEAVATECKATPRLRCNAGKITARAKLPAPMQPILRSSDRRAFTDCGESLDTAGIAIKARMGYSSNTV